MAENKEDNRICWRCVTERFLRAKIRKQGESARCDYCRKQANTLSISEVADEVRGAFDRHYIRTPAGPSEDEEFMYRDSDLNWQREGEPSTYAIAATAGVDEVAAEDIRAVLEETTGMSPDENFARDPDDEDEFSEEAQYAEKDVDATTIYRGWQHFKVSLRTEARLFNSTAQATLDSIFAGLDGHSTRAGRKVIVDAGPEQKLRSLHRARLFQSLDKLSEALKRPDLHLGPPPSELATAGRMNARGIAVFYGATHKEVAVGETRPPVGSHVLHGRFEIIRPLRLLDVEALRAIFVKGSIFDPEHLERLKKASFLAHVSKQITLPVMPDDEPFEYLVTQAIADYLANLLAPQLDGLIYRSVQHGEHKNNVVLFHKSARVELLEIPAGTEISAYTTSHDDEGQHADFRVIENVPAPKHKGAGNKEFDTGFLPHAGPAAPKDQRIAALRVDIESISVDRVEGASYSAEEFLVRRHRFTRSARIRRT